MGIVRIGDDEIGKIKIFLIELFFCFLRNRNFGTEKKFVTSCSIFCRSYFW